MKGFERDREPNARLVARLTNQGKVDAQVLAAFTAVPRRLFVGAPDQAFAYEDRSVPIECGQSLQSPTIMAQALTALSPTPQSKVLEIGCGSGFQAALLARLAGRIVTLDRFRTLVELAEDRLSALKVGNVTVLLADGLDGFTRHAPYDRILVDGAVERVPAALMDQLADKGTLVAPVGRGPVQTLVKIVRDGRLFHRTEIGPVRFVPLVEGVAARL